MYLDNLINYIFKDTSFNIVIFFCYVITYSFMHPFLNQVLAAPCSSMKRRTWPFPFTRSCPSSFPWLFPWRPSSWSPSPHAAVWGSSTLCRLPDPVRNIVSHRASLNFLPLKYIEFGVLKVFHKSHSVSRPLLLVNLG